MLVVNCVGNKRYCIVVHGTVNMERVEKKICVRFNPERNGKAAKRNRGGGNLDVQWNLSNTVTHGTGQKGPEWRGDRITRGKLHCGIQFGTEKE